MSTIPALRRQFGSEHEALMVARSGRGHTCRDYGYQGYRHPGRYLGHHALRRWLKRRRNRWLRKQVRAQTG